jgi:putrescine aminotransferase
MRLAKLFGEIADGEATGAHIVANGQNYLNCGGYGVFFVGAGHPCVVEAVTSQIKRRALSTKLFLDPVLAEASAALANVAPPSFDKIYFTTSGAEAVECAIKLARLHGKWRLVSMDGGYHGKTIGALSLTANGAYQDSFRPLLPDVTHVPFGDLAAIQAYLAEFGPESAIFVEPIQSEAGVVFPPVGYLSRLSELCRIHGAFLVIDEIMTGLGRTGHWWRGIDDSADPDLLLAGKALTGGVMPVAAVIANDRAFEPLDRDPFLHTSTFAGAPVACAAANAAVTVIAEEDLVQRSHSMGQRLLRGLLDVVDSSDSRSAIVQIRGEGLLIGIEFIDPYFAGEFVLGMVESGIVVNHSLNAHPVIRLTPPAIMSPSDEDRLLSTFSKVLKEQIHV